MNEAETTTLTIAVPEQAIGWFQTFVDRAYFDTFRDLAENFDEEEAYALRDAVYAINTAIIKAREAVTTKNKGELATDNLQQVNTLGINVESIGHEQ